MIHPLFTEIPLTLRVSKDAKVKLAEHAAAAGKPLRILDPVKLLEEPDRDPKEEP